MRGTILANLQMLGAVERPPMPDPVDEDPGAPPIDGALWVAGEWLWRGGEWVWLGGGWSLPDAPPAVRIEVDLGGTAVADPRPAVVDHREPAAAPPAPSRPAARDHRDPPPRSHDDPAPSRPRQRDHRDDDDDDIKVRDHRRK
ncbi:MAG: hypothetical protein H6708_10750 [Kofleriaceae bacterium]|nr:hypothetical protein [Kofleriaceae bacterium]